jgi:hypothetical protein
MIVLHVTWFVGACVEQQMAEDSDQSQPCTVGLLPNRECHWPDGGLLKTGSANYLAKVCHSAISGVRSRSFTITISNALQEYPIQFAEAIAEVFVKHRSSLLEDAREAYLAVVHSGLAELDWSVLLQDFPSGRGGWQDADLEAVLAHVTRGQSSS